MNNMLRQKKELLLLILVIISAILIISGCAHKNVTEGIEVEIAEEAAPEQSMFTLEDLQEAFQAAEDAMAITYAPEEWALSKEAFAEASDLCGAKEAEAGNVCQQLLSRSLEIIKKAESIARQRRSEAENAARGSAEESLRLYNLKPEELENEDNHGSSEK